MNIKAVIFDVDGTILDTREFVAQGFEHALAAHGHSVPPRSHIMANVAGISLQDCYATLAPDGDIIALCDTHTEFQHRRLDLVVAYDGLEDVFAQLRQKNIKLGICTSRHGNLTEMLEHTTISHHFDAVVSGSDITHFKPHPEGLLKVLEKLRVEPESSVMVGDTASDIGAGIAAGVAMTVGVTHGFHTRETLEKAGVDHVIDGLRELPALIFRSF